MSNARRRRVLVVDNNPHFRRAVQMLLRAKGYTVFAAGNPVEAKELATRERVHVAVLDARNVVLGRAAWACERLGL